MVGEIMKADVHLYIVMASAHDRARKPDHFGRKQFVAVAVRFAGAGIHFRRLWRSAQNVPVRRQVESSAGVVAANNFSVRATKLRTPLADVARVPDFPRVGINGAVVRSHLACRTICGNPVDLALLAGELLLRAGFVIRLPAAAPHLGIFQRNFPGCACAGGTDAGLCADARRKALGTQ